MGASKELQGIRDLLADARDSLDKESDTLSTIRSQVAEIGKKLDKEYDQRSRFPEQLTGTITRYRYGAFADDPGPAGEQVTHRFDLDCGENVTLHITVTSDKWDVFVMKAGIEMTQNTGEVWNGKDIIVKRDKDYGRYIPIGLASDPEVLAESSNGDGGEEKPLVSVPRKSARNGYRGGDIFPGDLVRFVPGGGEYLYGNETKLNGIAVNTDKRGNLQVLVKEEQYKSKKVRTDSFGGRISPDGDTLGSQPTFKVRRKRIFSVKSRDELTKEERKQYV